jgi:hypothetical protein
MKLLLAITSSALVISGCGGVAQSSTGTPSSTTSPIAVASSNPSSSANARITAAQKLQVQQTLQASMDHYSQEFVAGQTALSHKGTNDFYNWRHSTNIEQDVQNYLDAFKTADANYNADNEPTAISSWRDDMGTVQSDIAAWIQVAVGWQIGQKTDADLAAATATVMKDFATAGTDLAQTLAAS